MRMTEKLALIAALSTIGTAVVATEFGGTAAPGACPLCGCDGYDRECARCGYGPDGLGTLDEVEAARPRRPIEISAPFDDFEVFKTDQKLGPPPEPWRRQGKRRGNGSRNRKHG